MDKSMNEVYKMRKAWPHREAERQRKLCKRRGIEEAFRCDW